MDPIGKRLAEHARPHDGTERQTTVAHDARELRRMVKDNSDRSQIDGTLLVLYPHGEQAVYIHFESRVLYELFGLGMMAREYQPDTGLVDFKQTEFPK